TSWPTSVSGVATRALSCLTTRAHRLAGRSRGSRRPAGPITGAATLVAPLTHAKERLGQILVLNGKENAAVESLNAGDLGAVAKLKDVVTGDVLVDHEVPLHPPPIDFPQPLMTFPITPK